jgi:catechol 2,3-dioxygenase-like lactoylglutathione lyase family enzyme
VTRLVGINHVALEVGDVEEALAFYGRWFEFTLRGAQFERERAECESDSSVGSDP